MSKGWIGVDLDGTLAYYDKWRGIEHIGIPIPLMIDRVKKWLKDGFEVRIFTARCSNTKDDRDVIQAIKYIKDWCKLHIGQELEVTNIKDFGMIALWDDRAVRVIMNTGEEHGLNILS